MITATETIINEISSPVRDIHARVELYEGSTLIEVCNCHDRLVKFNIERIGDESKFFGFGICQRLNVHFIDKDRTLNISTANTMKVAYRIGENELVYPYPTFHVSEVNRDETTNELSVTAYDLMYPDSAHLVSDIELPASYNLLYFASAASVTLKAAGVKFANMSSIDGFMLNMPEGGNFDGSETVREALNDLAEATQTIYYIDNDNWLVFKRLDKDGEAALQITKEDYINLQSKTNRRLGRIFHATELGDNLETSGAMGTTQFVRDNAFWTMLEPTEIVVQLELAKDTICGLTINQFECSWRGNFLLEIGDKIALTTKDDSVVYAYVIDDVIEYAGYFTETTRWAYNANDAETDAAPTTLGEALNQTFAKVDKVNREIELLASKVENSDVGKVTEEVANLKLTTESITAEVSRLEKGIEEIENKVESTLTAENLSILVSNSINSVKTETGFTFDAGGLTIAKTDAATKTTISENGMTIYNMNDDPVLTANNTGVVAYDLHARTYLIIGETSRFEDYENLEGQRRTGCFWIG